jgi:hypothetical protein
LIASGRTPTNTAASITGGFADVVECCVVPTDDVLDCVGCCIGCCIGCVVGSGGVVPTDDFFLDFNHKNIPKPTNVKTKKEKINIVCKLTLKMSNIYYMK